MNNQQEEQEVNSNIEDNDPAYALAGSFGIDTRENIVSTIVNNTKHLLICGQMIQMPHHQTTSRPTATMTTKT